MFTCERRFSAVWTLLTSQGHQEVWLFEDDDFVPQPFISMNRADGEELAWWDHNERQWYVHTNKPAITPVSSVAPKGFPLTHETLEMCCMCYPHL